MKKKQLLSMVMIAALLLSATACGKSNENEKQGTSNSASHEEGADRVPIRWLTTGDAAAKAIQSDDRIVAAINEKLGIDLTVEIVPEANTEKVNVAMASGDFPDIVTGSFGTSATQQWIDDGMVVALNDYFEMAPDVKAWLEDYPWTAIDNKYYGAPFITQYEVANTLIIFRQDWLDALNLSYPKTLADMKEVMLAFTNNDPDGNKKNDTYGFTAEKLSSSSLGTPFDWVFFANGRPYADFALDSEGQVIPWFEDVSFIPSMIYIKDLWDSKVIDPELLLNDAPKKEEKFYQGKAGSMIAPLFRHVTRHESSLRQLYPEASISYDLPPAGENGARGLNRQGKDGMLTCITTASKQKEKAAAFLNFMVSKEGNDLLRLGIEGVHYTMDGDTILFHEEERAKDAFAADGWAHALAWGSFYWPLESGYIPDTDTNRERALETVKVASACQVPNLVKQKTPAEIAEGAAANDIFIQYFSDILQGKMSIEEGAAQMSKSWRSQGGEEILKEVNEVYQATK